MHTFVLWKVRVWKMCYKSWQPHFFFSLSTLECLLEILCFPQQCNFVTPGLDCDDDHSLSLFLCYLVRWLVRTVYTLLCTLNVTWHRGPLTLLWKWCNDVNNLHTKFGCSSSRGFVRTCPWGLAINGTAFHEESRILHIVYYTIQL